MADLHSSEIYLVSNFPREVEDKLIEKMSHGGRALSMVQSDFLLASLRSGKSKCPVFETYSNAKDDFQRGSHFAFPLMQKNFEPGSKFVSPGVNR